MIMPEKKEKPIVIELYELWNNIKARLQLVSPQPKSFTLLKEVRPVLDLGNFTLEMINLSDDTQVNSGGNSNIQILIPPAGKIYQIVDIRYTAPDPIGSAANSQYLMVRSNDGVNQIEHLKIEAPFSEAIYINRGEYYGSTSEEPTDATAQFIQLCQSLYSSRNAYLDFFYFNNTDVHQTGTRVLDILVKVFNEAI